MRPRSVALAAAMLAGLLAAPPATAESCNLVTDPRNDTAYAGRAETTGYAVQRSLDIVGADIATYRGALLGSIRLQSLTPDAGAPRDVVYRIEFSSGDRRLFVEAARGARGGFSAGRAGVTAHRIDGAVQPSANAVVFRAPVGVFGRGSIGRDSVLANIAVSAVGTYADRGQPAPGVDAVVQVADHASSGLVYAVGTPSCIVPRPARRKPPARPRPTHEPTARPRPEPTAEPTAHPTAQPEPEPASTPTDPEPTPPMP